MTMLFPVLRAFMTRFAFSIFLFRAISLSKLSALKVVKLFLLNAVFSIVIAASPVHIPNNISFLFLFPILAFILSRELSKTFHFILAETGILFILFLPLCICEVFLALAVEVLFSSYITNPELHHIIALIIFCPIAYFVGFLFPKTKLDMLLFRKSGKVSVFCAAIIDVLLLILSISVAKEKLIRDMLTTFVLILLSAFYAIIVWKQTVEDIEEIAKRDEEIDKSAAEIHDMKNAMMARAREAERLAGDLDVSPAEEMAAIQNPDDPEEERKIIFNSTGLLFFNSLLYNHARKARERGVTLDIKVLARATTLFLRYLPIWKFIHYAIGNLLENAVSSAAETEHPNPEVLFLFGCSPSGVYQVLVSDNGPDFEKEVLEHLGERGNTTKGSGHGNGFYSILKVVRLARASFVLREGPEKLYPYTKQIGLIFDGAGRIEIQSRRAGNLRPKDPQIILTQTGEEAYV
ncbi:hypothetical protein H8S23_11445 [Anaerofilum sp. BX8]|uniref:Histidine kinase/HSP90-like ATPase domain-containing protein n=1 Tax=Anaerofilum hominis TaxID=2763016 RepID=A0A923I8A4_9FIRM|nr:ATP-binding protein [Anaerofilum hominis]MBC5582121.1 hypothetical protein [Anaerofilum hominis]